jgi:hypothetical protein
MAASPPISPDGSWYWDGAAWRSLVSADGRTRWNGTAWVAREAAPEPSAATTAHEPAHADRPDWLVAEAEYHGDDRRATLAAPPAPFTPDGAPKATAQSFKLHHLIGVETIAPLVLAGFVGALGLGWYFSQAKNQVQPPDVLVAGNAKIGYQTGEVLRFAVTQEQHGQLSVPGGTPQDEYDSVNAVEAWRVISAGTDGTYTIGIKFEKLSGQFNGQDLVFDTARAKEAVLVVKPDGRIVSGGTNGSTGGKTTNTVPASDQFFSILPDHTVKAGDRWGTSWTRPNPLGTGTTTYNTTSTFVHYDALSQFGSCAVVRTQASLPIDVGMNVRQLLELTGEDTTGIPAGATIQDKGSANADITTYVDMSSRLPVHMLDVSNFDFTEAFQGLPNTNQFAGLQGSFHFTGHQSGSMDLLELPKPV